MTIVSFFATRSVSVISDVASRDEYEEESSIDTLSNGVCESVEVRLGVQNIIGFGRKLLSQWIYQDVFCGHISAFEQPFFNRVSPWKILSSLYKWQDWH